MRRSLLLVLTMLGLLIAPGATAATTEVTVNDNFYDPAVTAVAIGGSVHWSRADTSVRPHTVTANNGFWDTSCNPCVGPIDVTATLSAGTFHYYCRVHGSPDGSPSEGMNGYVRVPAQVSAAPAGRPFTVTWATAASDTGSRYDVQYRKGAGKWHAWLSKTAALRAVFGRNGKPVVVKHGAVYSFRARSRTAKGPSGWSPPVSFTA